MIGNKSAGFTVIETILYLAVTGLLAVGVLAGATTAINQQRYKDATNSFVDYLQSGYDQTINVQNDRPVEKTCDSASQITDSPDPAVEVRGATECFVIGQLISTDDGRAFTMTVVYGSQDGSKKTNDTDALTASNLFLGTTSNTYTLEWDTKIVQPGTATPILPTSILIVRSPSSGVVRTYIGAKALTLSALITAGAVSTDTLFCVDPSGWTGATRDGAVVRPDTTNSSGVKLAGPGGGC